VILEGRLGQAASLTVICTKVVVHNTHEISIRLVVGVCTKLNVTKAFARLHTEAAVAEASMAVSLVASRQFGDMH
jgi:hypothetical protein